MWTWKRKYENHQDKLHHLTSSGWICVQECAVVFTFSILIWIFFNSLSWQILASFYSKYDSFALFNRSIYRHHLLRIDQNKSVRNPIHFKYLKKIGFKCMQRCILVALCCLNLIRSLAEKKCKSDHTIWKYSQACRLPCPFNALYSLIQVTACVIFLSFFSKNFSFNHSKNANILTFEMDCCRAEKFETKWRDKERKKNTPANN